MARDTVQILRSSVPLLRPQDRCPGELFVNFADRIFGYIDAAGVPQDVGPLVFQTVAALAAYDATVNPPNGVLAFAADAFYLKEVGGTATDLPGWRELALGGDDTPPYDDTELRQLLALETQNRIVGDIAVETTLTAQITTERVARIDGDAAVAQSVTTLTATVASNDAITNARIEQESLVRADADSALASEIVSLESELTRENTELAARVTTETQARIDGDEALASRTTTLEVSRVVDRQSGGNLIDNALATDGTAGWELGPGWSREPRVTGPSAFAFVGRGTGRLQANDGEYRPVPAKRLDCSVWTQRLPGTVGTFTARLDLGTAIGEPLAALVQVLDATDILTRETFSFDLPVEAANYALSFTCALTAGQVEVRAPFLGYAGNFEATGDFDELSARITEESLARVQGDEALGVRSDNIEVALRSVAQSTASNLISNSVLDTPLGWRFQGNTYAGPLLPVFGPGVPSANGIIFDATPSGQSFANPFDPIDEDDFLPLIGVDVNLTFRYATQIFNAPPYDVDYLIVGGGGAALTLNTNTGGGGGGGGGILTGTWTVATTNVYQVVVGNGGVAGSVLADAQGKDSSAFNQTALGGGRGGGPTAPGAPAPGGSGGGGTGGNVGTAAPGALGMPGQGNAGGTGITSGASEQPQNGGGGGGYLTAGQNATDTTAGVGGNGLLKTINGVTYELGAGGDGRRRVTLNEPVVSGAPNTGQGGYGGRNNNNINITQPGNGGSGVVILEMAEIYYSGKVTGNPDVFIANGRVTLRFVRNGSYTA